jgi:YHS domain-containing protein/ElaB/YqjD/DUF883 family membrane-anchored ribosome-binding protein
MGRDPVCNQEVDERSPYSSTYQNKTYYFNTPECKADFDKNPDRFAVGSEAGSAAEWAGAGIQGQGRRMSSRARAKLKSVISDRKGKAAESIGAVSSAFRTASQHLRDQHQEAMAGYAEKAAANVDRFSGYLQQHDAEDIINQAENFVRRRPVLVVGGAIAAGFLLARFLKSSKSVSA